MDAQVLGISVDHIPCLQAWAESLGKISYPLLSDFWPHGAVAEKYGVLRPADGFTERAIFVIDKDGVIRYIDIHAIGDQPDNEVLRGELRRLQSTPVEQAAYPPALYEDDEVPEGGVVLYCTRWCKDCRKVRAWLESHGLEYVEVDIDYNLKARARVRQLANGAMVTPTVDLYGAIVLDYKEDKLEEALRQAKQKGRI